MPRRVIRFGPKVKEIDRQYELNNNGELDNGVYHQDGEDGGVCNESKQSANGGGLRPTSMVHDSYLASFGQQ